MFDNLPFETVYRIYPKWLKAAYNYYHEEIFEDCEMTDDVWTHLSYYFAKHVDKIPYLQSIDFVGATLGVYPAEGLLVEIHFWENLPKK